MELEYKALPFSLESGEGEAAKTGAEFRGYASSFHNIDDSFWGDIIQPGAFKADLPDFLEDGLVMWQHDWEEPIGKPVEATEDAKGLFIHATVSDTARGKDARILIRDNIVRKLSIGFKVMGRDWLEDEDQVKAYWSKWNYTATDDDRSKARFGARLLTRIKLYEISPVSVPANRNAAITEVTKGGTWGAMTLREKRTLAEEGLVVEKGATGAGGLPLATRDHPWDASAAEGRVKSWAGATEKPNEKYRSAHFWYDAAKPDEFGSYKLPFADAIGEKLTAVPRGIFAVAACLQGARGGVDIPDADKTIIKVKVDHYYARMRREFDDETIITPWKKAADIVEQVRRYINAAVRV
jgi:HK97 family phage prohead protease